MNTPYIDIRRTAIAFAILCALVTSGCGTQSSPSSSTSPAAPAPPKPFNVGYNQWIGYVGLFMAQDKGYFKDAGLDVEPKQFNGPADGVVPLIAGQLDADMTTADTVVLLADKATGNAITNVYIIDTSDGADGVIAQKQYKDIKSLKGQTVAATLGQCNELLLLNALAKVGMTEKDVKLTNMDADTAGAAVLANKVAAAVTWEPWLSKAEANGASVIYSSHDLKNVIMDTVAVSKTTLTNRPDDVKKYLAAYAKGADYALAHPDEAAQVAAKYLGTTAPEAKHMLTKVDLYGAAANKKLIGTAAAPGPVFATATKIGQFYVAQKQVTAVPDVSALFTADYLPQ